MKRIQDKIRNLPGRITISRTSNSRSEDKIRIAIEDYTSGIQFFEGEMDLADFGRAITGYGSMPIQGDFTVTDDIGKVLVQQTRVAIVPKKVFEAKAKDERYGEHRSVREHLVSLHEGTEWSTNAYVGSQKSFVSLKNGDQEVHYSVYKFVDAPTEGE